MSQLQYWQELGQLEELEELERAAREEAEWRANEDAALERQDREFCDELAERFPILRAWPGKESK